jgi:phosphate starvation-inducible protein PhoH and related proteins
MGLYHFGSKSKNIHCLGIDCRILTGYSGPNFNSFVADCQPGPFAPPEASNQRGAKSVADVGAPSHISISPAWRAPSRVRRSFPRLMRKHLEITPNLEPLFGTRDENLRLMEDALHARIDLISDAVMVEGSEDAIVRVERIFQDYEALRRQGILLQNGELNGMLRLVTADPSVSLRTLAESGKQRSAGIKRMVQPRSLNQRHYVEAIEQADMVFGIGPAGTGKTYLAVAMAAAALLAKKISRIVLVRPAVEAGERLGFLPGTLQEKVDPYLRPLYDALYDLLEPERVDKMLERNVIEVAPLAFMRGRTLNDCFIIMDEAQNTTSEQMKMFLTRMGNNAKAVITGDITQIDLPNPRKSGLVEAINILEGVDGIRFIRFEDGDVVRHQLVQRIIRAYEGFGRTQPELPLAIGDDDDEVRFSQPQ